VYRLARLGFAAKGLLYVIAGATAALAVVKIGGRPVGTRGALNLLAGQPFGRAGLALVAVGLGGFILRRVLQIFVPPEGRPRLPVMRYLRPAGYLLSGLGHAGVALTAFQLVVGWRVRSPGTGARTRDWTTLATAGPFGGWLVLLMGLAVVGFAVFHFYMAATARFRVDLQVEQISGRWRGVVFSCGRGGYAARGMSFLIAGGVFVYAGLSAGSGGAHGIGGALRTIEALPFGTLLLLLIAGGLIAYGLYLIFVARYLRLIAGW
jgi:hypothetical protein